MSIMDEQANLSGTPKAPDGAVNPAPVQLEAEGPTQEEIDAAKLIGTCVGGRYSIEKVLGAGGMSVVYQARQLGMDRIVALKTLHLELTNEPVILQRFQREIMTLSRLNHPNIVTVYDCLIGENNQPFIVMDFVDGQSLEDLLFKERRLSPEKSRKIFIQVCNALEHAHRHGVIHRDIKPGNIMLTGRPEDVDYVKVVDFGLAKLTESNSQKLTQTGHLWGSAPYMSPEQCQANEEVEVDSRTDIYSFGAVMYEVLTGADPFLGDTIMDTLWKHLNEDPARFSQVDPSLKISPMVESVVFKALEKHREDRYQSMAELREAIEHAIAEAPNPVSTRTGMAPARPMSSTRTGMAKKKPNNPFLPKKKQSLFAEHQNTIYGFMCCALLVVSFAITQRFLTEYMNHGQRIQQPVPLETPKSVKVSTPHPAIIQTTPLGAPKVPPSKPLSVQHEKVAPLTVSEHDRPTPHKRVPAEPIAVHKVKPHPTAHIHAASIPEAKNPGGQSSRWDSLEKMRSSQ